MQQPMGYSLVGVETEETVSVVGGECFGMTVECKTIDMKFIWKGSHPFTCLSLFLRRLLLSTVNTCSVTIEKHTDMTHLRPYPWWQVASLVDRHET